MNLLRLVWPLRSPSPCAAPAAAQRYTAKQNGDVVELDGRDRRR